MATLVNTDGTKLTITPANGEAFTLEELQGYVGGYVEFVYLGGGRDQREVLVVNENGLNEKLSVNAYGTARYRGSPPRHDGIIVGDCVEALIVDMGLDTERIF